MNDLSQYNAFANKLRPGDLVFFWGPALLSKLIEYLGGNEPSHVVVVEEAAADSPDGKVRIVQSTIEGAVSGIQRDTLDAVILSYPEGTKVGAALLSDAERARADWTKLIPFVDGCIGPDPLHPLIAYDKIGLVKFLEPESFREGQANDHKMVCSSFATACLETVGILTGIPYSQASPQLLIQMNIFQPAFIPLLGVPKPHNFDTVL